MTTLASIPPSVVRAAAGVLACSAFSVVVDAARATIGAVHVAVLAVAPQDVSPPPVPPPASGSTAPEQAASGARPALGAAHFEPSWRARRDEAIRELRRQLLPEPLRPEEFDHWGVVVELDPERFELLREMHAAYGARVEQSADAAALRDAMVSVAYDWDPVGLRFRPSFTPVQLDALDARDAMIELLAPADEMLAQSFLQLVRPAALHDAKQAIFRRHFGLHAVPTIRRSAGVDLVTILDAARLTADERALVARTVEDYMLKMTAATRWRFQEATRLEREQVALLVELGPLWESTIDPAERAAVDDDLADLRAALLRTELPVSGLNRETLLRLVRELPAPAAGRVEAAFWERVRPELFDDERELSELFRDAVDSPAPLADEERLGRTLLLAATRLRLLPQGIAAADLADEIAAIIALGPPSDDTRRAAARIDLELRRLDVMRQRRVICSEAARSINDALTVEEAATREVVERYLLALSLREQTDRWLTARYRARRDELAQLERSGGFQDRQPAGSPGEGATPEGDQAGPGAANAESPQAEP